MRRGAEQRRAPDDSDLVAGGMWFLAIVPAAFGFWIVAGDIVGVSREDLQTLLVASMLAIGIATLLQVAVGYRLPVFEGPAASFLAAIALLAVSSPSPEQATGGLIVAGGLVLVLGLLGADRLFERLFTPPVVNAFVLILVIIAAPPTIDRALGIGSGHAIGTAAAWSGTITVVGVAVACQRIGKLRQYSILLALVAGMLVFFAADGFPHPEFASGALVAPSLFPWGTPDFAPSVVAPFLIAGLIAAFNTVASMRVMSETIEVPLDRTAGHRALVTHGGAQAFAACIGNVLGHVPRLDSSGVVRLIDNRGRLALGLAAVAIIVVSFLGPAVDLLTYLPVSVSAALLAVVLGILAEHGLRAAAAMDSRSRWAVMAPAVAPALIWLPLADEMSETAQLVTNPLLVGIVAAVTLDHIVRGRGSPALPNDAGHDQSTRKKGPNWQRS